MSFASRDVDAGWAWWVLGASYFNELLVSGLAYVAGMFQVLFLKEFHGSVALTAWITSLFSSLMQLGGPFSSVVCNVSSCRTATMMGGMCLTVGLVISGLVKHLGLLFLFFGVVAGIGMGLTHTASIVVISYYFEKRRTLVNGLVFSAGGLGILLAPQLSRFLFDHFAWREALFILAGVSAHICVFGALMFPIHEKKNGYCKIFQCRNKDRSDSGDWKQDGNDSENKNNLMTVSELHAGSGYSMQSTHISSVSSEENIQIGVSDSNKDLHDPERETMQNVIEQDVILLDEGKFESEPDSNSSHALAVHRHTPLYKNRMFLVLCVCLFLGNAGGGVFLIYIASFLETKELSSQEVTNVLSVNGAGVLCGRVFLSALANSAPGNEVLFLFALHVVGGVLITLFPVVCTDYVSSTLMMLFMSCYCGTVPALLPTITIQYVGLRRLATAFGIEMVCSGLGYLVSPPMAGMLVDYVNTYDYNMYIGGSLFISAGLIIMVFPYMKASTK